MSFNAENAILQAYPNCKHCHGKGSIERSFPQVRNIDGQILHIQEYCWCITNPRQPRQDLNQKIKVFDLGKKNG